MARNGSIQLPGMVVQSVSFTKGANNDSTIVVKGSQYTITIAKTGGFPDDLKLREDYTMDLRVDFDK
jgi:hypothetical protein